jgi:hypothetical protein
MTVPELLRVLKYRCPHSGREVETSIRTDDGTLGEMYRMMLSFWCPHCNDSHRIKASDAYIDAVSIDPSEDVAATDDAASSRALA